MAGRQDGPGRPAPTADPPRVPYALRGAVDAACRLRPVRAWGRRAYALVARHCARRLAAFPGAEAVYLRGRDVRACDPGISDLDFWLFCADDVLHDPAALVDLRRRFQAVRRATILPGKLELTSERAWAHALRIAPAALAEDLPLRRLTATGWEPLPIAPARPARLAGRVGLGGRNLALALAHLARASSGGRYDAAVAARYLGKAHAAATGAPDPRRARRPTARALAETLVALHELAEQALAQPSPTVAATLTIRADASGQPAPPAATPALDRIVARLARDGVPVTAGSPPGVLLWRPDVPDADAAERLFAALLRSPADLAGERSGAPPTVATLAISRCLWRGPRLGPLLERLPAIPPACAPPPGGEPALAADVYLHRLETLATRVNHAPGAFVSYPAAEFATPLLYQCAELLVVATGCVTNDLDALCAQARERVPDTTAWLGRLRAGRRPTDLAGWSEAFAQVRAEALSTLDELADHAG